MDNVEFLRGRRYKTQANETYRVLTTDFDSVRENPAELGKLVAGYIKRFLNEQKPRLVELKRYYNGDNNINYREIDRDEYSADNRISSDWAKYITTFNQGYILGNPVQYTNDDGGVSDKIAEFSAKNNEDYQNGLIETDLSIYGRAYELIYVDTESDERFVKLDPESTFVVYDETIEANSLFGIRFYLLPDGDKEVGYTEVYTANAKYTFKSNDTFEKLELIAEQKHYLQGVPVNEYRNNEERMGDYESVLDNIDAYDLSQSELANFQQDSTSAYLMINGNPLTGTEDKDPEALLKQMRKARLLIMDDNPNPDGAAPDAKYLVKTYDTTGAEAYKKRLVDDILRFTLTPDTSDQNFAGTQSGESMKYKLMGNDNLAKTKVRLLTKGFMRRLRLVANLWSLKNSVDNSYSVINDTVIKFTPNLPASETELVGLIKQLYGIVSDETLFTLLQEFTGVDPEVEIERLRNQVEADTNKAIELSEKATYNKLPNESEVNADDE